MPSLMGMMVTVSILGEDRKDQTGLLLGFVHNLVLLTQRRASLKSMEQAKIGDLNTLIHSGNTGSQLAALGCTLCPSLATSRSPSVNTHVIDPLAFQVEIPLDLTTSPSHGSATNMTQGFHNALPSAYNSSFSSYPTPTQVGNGWFDTEYLHELR